MIEKFDPLEQWLTEYIAKGRKYRKKYYKENHIRIKESTVKWRKDNPEKVKEWSKQYNSKRYKTDLKYNLNSKISCLMWYSLKKNKANRTWKSLVDYTLADLIKRLNETMPVGYTFKDLLNGKLHIDHILPKRLFQFKTSEDEEFKQCWSLYNLRLLPAKENLIKHDNIANPILLGLLLNQ